MLLHFYMLYIMMEKQLIFFKTTFCRGFFGDKDSWGWAKYTKIMTSTEIIVRKI